MRRTEARPYPKSVCLETYSLCNGSCSFCPYKRISQAPVKLESAVVYRLIDEISEMPVERFSLFNNNEPLLDDRILDFIRYARAKMPSIQATISSNGRILTAERIVQVIQAGIDRFFISIPTLNSEAYQQIMGADLKNIVAAIYAVPEEFYPNLRIAVPKTKYFDHEQFVEAFLSKKIKYIVWDMEASRGWKELAAIREISQLHDRIGCDRPLDQAIISSNGDVLICCRDWGHDHCLGNVKTASLLEIWTGEKMRKIQEAVASERFSSISLCSKCSRVTSLDL